MGAAPQLDALRDAYEHGYAVAAINVYNLEGIVAVAAAAEAEARAAIVQTGSSALAAIGSAELAATALAVREVSDARLGVHLDHCRDLAELQRCLDAGYDSVMFDGSHLPFGENVAITRRAARAAHASGAWIEGELGAIAGNEDCSTDAVGGTHTDADAARRFVEDTGVDALAVAVGNVHGIPSNPVTLDLARLGAIRNATDVPLVLHGASGLPAAELREAIALGVAKINVNTEVRRAYLGALRRSLNSSASDDVAGHLGTARRAATDVVRTAIRTFGCVAPNSSEGAGHDA